MMPAMSLTTTVYQRGSSAGLETITVIASVDEDGAEIRVIHELDGTVVEDSIPHYGPDPEAGRRWLTERRETYLADGYQLVEESEDPNS
jgi:hypothetical protein